MQELAGLRRANRDLLGRLRAQQEEIRRRLPRGAAGPAPPGGKENQGPVTEATSHPGRLVSVEPSPSAAWAALCSPLTPTERGRGAPRHRASTQKAAALEGGSLGAERSSTPAAAVTRCARGASRAARDSRSPDGESLLPGHRESGERFVTLRSPREKGRVGTKLEPVLNQTQAEENGKHPVLVREPRRPKSILLMPQRREAKVKPEPPVELSSTDVGRGRVRDWLPVVQPTKESQAQPMTSPRFPPSHCRPPGYHPAGRMHGSTVSRLFLEQRQSGQPG